MKKFWAFFKIAQQELMEYRGDAIIWALSGVVSPVISLAIWLSISASNQNLIFSKQELIVYFLLVYLVQVLTSAWGAHFVIQDIRSGKFSKYLLKPFSILHDYGSNNISEKTFKLVITLISIIILWYLLLFNQPLNIEINFLKVILFIVSIIFAGTIAFITDIIIGLLAFWVYNAYFIRDFYFIFRMFLTGSIIPIYFLPFWLFNLSIFLPFRYMVSFPVEVLMSKVTGFELLIGFVIQIVWLLVIYLLYRFVYEYGIKSNQSYGI